MTLATSREFLGIIVSMFLNPVDFYRRNEETAMGAVLFAGLSATVYSFMVGLQFSLKHIGTTVSTGAATMMGLGETTTWLLAFTGGIMSNMFFLIPGVLAGLGIAVIGVHLSVPLLGGGNVRETVKALGFATMPLMFFGWIPYVEYVVPVYMAVLAFVGIREIHGFKNIEAFIATSPLLVMALGYAWISISPLIGM